MSVWTPRELKVPPELQPESPTPSLAENRLVLKSGVYWLMAGPVQIKLGITGDAAIEWHGDPMLELVMRVEG